MPTLPILSVQFLQQLFQDQFVVSALLIPAGLILLDLVTGILSALKMQTFAWKRLGDVLGGNVLHYLVAIICVDMIYLLWGASASTAVGLYLSMGGLTASLIGSIMENVKELTGNDPLVDQVIQEEIQNLAGQSITSVPPAPAPDLTPLATPSIVSDPLDGRSMPRISTIGVSGISPDWKNYTSTKEIDAVAAAKQVAQGVTLPMQAQPLPASASVSRGIMPNVSQRT